MLEVPASPLSVVALDLMMIAAFGVAAADGVCRQILGPSSPSSGFGDFCSIVCVHIPSNDVRR